MGLSLPKSNLIFLKKCLDKWVHFIQSRYCPPVVLRYAFSVHFRIIYSAI